MPIPSNRPSWIPGLSRRAASVALTLGFMLIPAVLAGGSAQARTYSESVLYSFSVLPDGNYPSASVLLDKQGNVFGTTLFGGANCQTGQGCGTVFKVDPGGHEVVLYNFCSVSGCNDGMLPGPNYPGAGLVRDGKGNLYSTTPGGGGHGDGTVFMLDAGGNETVLYSFCAESACADGNEPLAGLVRDADGNLYGTTWQGGYQTYCCGTVFKLSQPAKKRKPWKETVLYRFCLGGSPCNDGSSPFAGLVMDESGNLYGTTAGGGLGNAGTVFKLSRSGNESVLYSFCVAGNPCGDGWQPQSGLVIDTMGNLYGTTVGGGTGNGGTVFKLDPGGHETVLHAFIGGSDGVLPDGDLTIDKSGNLFGTTYYGGLGGGTVYKVDTKGRETVLYSFCSKGYPCIDGALPYAGLAVDKSDNLYGTTFYGGTGTCSISGGVGCGVVFKLTH